MRCYAGCPVSAIMLALSFCLVSNRPLPRCHARLYCLVTADIPDHPNHVSDEPDRLAPPFTTDFRRALARALALAMLLRLPRFFRHHAILRHDTVTVPAGHLGNVQSEST